MKLLIFTLIFLGNLFALESHNTHSNTYKFTSAQELKKNYFTIISPYYYAKKIHYFNSFDGIKIAYKIFTVKNPKAVLVISSGRTEGMLKYQEFIYDMNQNGYSVYILDHRGQGNSQRLLKDTQIGHVNNFEDYIKDMHIFVTKFVPKANKRVLVGHSMGGAIASLYAEEFPHDFTALMLSSPMHQPDLVSAGLSGIVCSIVESRKHNIDILLVKNPMTRLMWRLKTIS